MICTARLRITVLALCQIALLGGVCRAAGRWGDQQPDGQRALSSFPNASWWDRDTAELMPPTVENLQDNPIRTEGWKGKRPATSDWSFWDLFDGWNLSWLPSFSGSTFATVIYVILFCLLVAVVAFIVWWALRDYVPSFRRASQPVEKEIKIDPRKVENLPFVAKPNMGDPLSMARQYMQQNQFELAIIYLYGYYLLALDQRRKLHLQAGKTNRMYLREIESEPLVDQVRPAMVLFEDTYFGKHSVSRQQFMACWDRLDEFHCLLAPVAQPATAVKQIAEVSA